MLLRSSLRRQVSAAATAACPAEIRFRCPWCRAETESSQSPRLLAPSEMDRHLPGHYLGLSPAAFNHVGTREGFRAILQFPKELEAVLLIDGANTHFASLGNPAPWTGMDSDFEGSYVGLVVVHERIVPFASHLFPSVVRYANISHAAASSRKALASRPSVDTSIDRTPPNLAVCHVSRAKDLGDLYMLDVLERIVDVVDTDVPIAILSLDNDLNRCLLRSNHGHRVSVNGSKQPLSNITKFIQSQSTAL